MSNDLKSGKLTLKLVSLVLVGTLLPLIIVVYFLRRVENIGDYSGLIFSVGTILALYAFVSIYFLTNFLKAIKAVESQRPT